ncbi:hypothetical protein O0L34_g16004 [Tuta absoluta]|nr:hypothetical protein O0L34_g16004 [Tuta absoluta]
MVMLFKITLLALVALTTAAPSLSARDQQLAQITGASDVAGIQKVFQQVFQSSDIDQVLQKVSQVTKQKDAVAFMKWTLQITAQKNLLEASKIFLMSTTQKMTFLEYLNNVATMLQHDLKDFYVQIVRQAAKPTLQEAFGVLVQLLDKNDFFDMLKNVAKYTKHPDPIQIHEIQFKATGTKNLQESFSLLIKDTNTKNLLDAYAAIQAATNQDIVDVIQIIGTFKANNWEGKLTILKNYTKTSDFISALKALPAATGESNALNALKKIANQ